MARVAGTVIGHFAREGDPEGVVGILRALSGQHRAAFDHAAGRALESGLRQSRVDQKLRDAALERGCFCSRNTPFGPLFRPRWFVSVSPLAVVCFRIALAHRDGGGIARYVPDQALFARCRDARLMQLPGQLRLSEFGESV